MKSSVVLFLSSVIASQAAVVHFDLSPAGTDAAVGLSPSNQVPAVTNSTGSGNTISGGIKFDTDTLVLDLAIGYGSAAGFTDLTGVPTGMHIHGPAPAGSNAAVLVDLAPYSFLAATQTSGGVIIGSILYSSNAVAGLLGGSNYINIHTELNPSGEIRGQLIPGVDAAPTLVCPAPTNVQCGTTALLSADVSDPEGDALTVVWTVNGNVTQTNLVPSGTPGAITPVTLAAAMSLGTNAVGISVTDSASNVVSCATTISVVDTNSPVIGSAKASPCVLWPPNHKMVPVTVSARVADKCSATAWKITGVSSSSEAVTSKGHGNGNGNSGHGNNGNGNNGNGNNSSTQSDWEITGDHTVNLRAERAGNEGNRVYYITIQATDESGNLSAPKKVIVLVPHSQGNR